eukprot:6127165-Prymnesium_polylepis.2
MASSGWSGSSAYATSSIRSARSYPSAASDTRARNHLPPPTAGPAHRARPPGGEASSQCLCGRAPLRTPPPPFAAHARNPPPLPPAGPAPLAHPLGCSR